MAQLKVGWLKKKESLLESSWFSQYFITLSSGHIMIYKNKRPDNLSPYGDKLVLDVNLASCAVERLFDDDNYAKCDKFVILPPNSDSICFQAPLHEISDWVVATQLHIAFANDRSNADASCYRGEPGGGTYRKMRSAAADDISGPPPTELSLQDRLLCVQELLNWSDKDIETVLSSIKYLDGRRNSSSNIKSGSAVGAKSMLDMQKCIDTLREGQHRVIETIGSLREGPFYADGMTVLLQINDDIGSSIEAGDRIILSGEMYGFDLAAMKPDEKMMEGYYRDHGDGPSSIAAGLKDDEKPGRELQNLRNEISQSPREIPSIRSLMYILRRMADHWGTLAAVEQLVEQLYDRDNNLNHGFISEMSYACALQTLLSSLTHCSHDWVDVELATCKVICVLVTHERDSSLLLTLTYDVLSALYMMMLRVNHNPTISGTNLPAPRSGLDSSQSNSQTTSSHAEEEHNIYRGDRPTDDIRAQVASALAKITHVLCVDWKKRQQQQQQEQQQQQQVGPSYASVVAAGRRRSGSGSGAVSGTLPVPAISSSSSPSTDFARTVEAIMSIVYLICESLPPLPSYERDEEVVLLTGLHGGGGKKMTSRHFFGEPIVEDPAESITRVCSDCISKALVKCSVTISDLAGFPSCRAGLATASSLKLLLSWIDVGSYLLHKIIRLLRDPEYSFPDKIIARDRILNSASLIATFELVTSAATAVMHLLAGAGFQGENAGGHAANVPASNGAAGQQFDYIIGWIDAQVTAAGLLAATVKFLTLYSDLSNIPHGSDRVSQRLSLSHCFTENDANSREYIPVFAAVYLAQALFQFGSRQQNGHYLLQIGAPLALCSLFGSAVGIRENGEIPQNKIPALSLLLPSSLEEKNARGGSSYGSSRHEMTADMGYDKLYLDAIIPTTLDTLTYFVFMTFGPLTLTASPSPRTLGKDFGIPGSFIPGSGSALTPTNALPGGSLGAGSAMVQSSSGNMNSFVDFLCGTDAVPSLKIILPYLSRGNSRLSVLRLVSTLSESVKGLEVLVDEALVSALVEIAFQAHDGLDLASKPAPAAIDSDDDIEDEEGSNGYIIGSPSSEEKTPNFNRLSGGSSTRERERSISNAISNAITNNSSNNNTDNNSTPTVGASPRAKVWLEMNMRQSEHHTITASEAGLCSPPSSNVQTLSGLPPLKRPSDIFSVSQKNSTSAVIASSGSASNAMTQRSLAMYKDLRQFDIDGGGSDSLVDSSVGSPAGGGGVSIYQGRGGDDRSSYKTTAAFHNNSNSRAPDTQNAAAKGVFPSSVPMFGFGVDENAYKAEIFTEEIISACYSLANIVQVRTSLAENVFRSNGSRLMTVLTKLVVSTNAEIGFQSLRCLTSFFPAMARLTESEVANTPIAMSSPSTIAKTTTKTAREGTTAVPPKHVLYKQALSVLNISLRSSNPLIQREAVKGLAAISSDTDAHGYLVGDPAFRGIISLVLDRNSGDREARMSIESVFKNLGFLGGIKDLELCYYDANLVADWFNLRRSLQSQALGRLVLVEWITNLFPTDSSNTDSMSIAKDVVLYKRFSDSVQEFLPYYFGIDAKGPSSSYLLSTGGKASSLLPEVSSILSASAKSTAAAAASAAAAQAVAAEVLAAAHTPQPTTTTREASSGSASSSSSKFASKLTSSFPFFSYSTPTSTPVVAVTPKPSPSGPVPLPLDLTSVRSKSKSPPPLPSSPPAAPLQPAPAYSGLDIPPSGVEQLLSLFIPSKLHQLFFMDLTSFYHDALLASYPTSLSSHVASPSHAASKKVKGGRGKFATRTQCGTNRATQVLLEEDGETDLTDANDDHNAHDSESERYDKDDDEEEDNDGDQRNTTSLSFHPMVASSNITYVLPALPSPHTINALHFPPRTYSFYRIRRAVERMMDDGGTEKAWALAFCEDSFAAEERTDFHAALTQMICKYPQIKSLAFSAKALMANMEDRCRSLNAYTPITVSPPTEQMTHLGHMAGSIPNTVRFIKLHGVLSSESVQALCILLRNNNTVFSPTVASASTPGNSHGTNSSGNSRNKKISSKKKRSSKRKSDGDSDEVEYQYEDENQYVDGDKRSTIDLVELTKFRNANTPSPSVSGSGGAGGMGLTRKTSSRQIMLDEKHAILSQDAASVNATGDPVSSNLLCSAEGLTIKHHHVSGSSLSELDDNNLTGVSSTKVPKGSDERHVKRLLCRPTRGLLGLAITHTPLSHADVEYISRLLSVYAPEDAEMEYAGTGGSISGGGSSSSKSRRGSTLTVGGGGGNGKNKVPQKINAQKALSALFADPCPPGIRFLDLSCCKLGDSGSTAILKASAYGPLEGLDLGGNYINKAASFVEIFRSLFVGATKNYLRHLGLASNQFPPSVVCALLDAVQQNNTIHSLDLSFNDIEDSPLVADCLRQFLRRNKAMRILNLGGNKLGREVMGAIYLGILENDSLLLLSLVGNEGVSVSGAEMSFIQDKLTKNRTRYKTAVEKCQAAINKFQTTQASNTGTVKTTSSSNASPSRPKPKDLRSVSHYANASFALAAREMVRDLANSKISPTPHSVDVKVATNQGPGLSPTVAATLVNGSAFLDIPVAVAVHVESLGLDTGVLLQTAHPCEPEPLEKDSATAVGMTPASSPTPPLQSSVALPESSSSYSLPPAPPAPSFASSAATSAPKPNLNDSRGNQIEKELQLQSISLQRRRPIFAKSHSHNDALGDDSQRGDAVMSPTIPFQVDRKGSESPTHSEVSIASVTSSVATQPFESSIDDRDDEFKPSNALYVFFSAPLAFKEINSKKLHSLDLLDYGAERDSLIQVLREVHRNITVNFAFATTNNLITALTFGCRVLHFSGHGHPERLNFEDGRGGLHLLTVQKLRDILNAEKVKLDFVFVSACYSRKTGEAFVEAGVKHVVCVRVDAMILDSAANAFTRAFYLALFTGKTVQQSFDIAREALKSSPYVSNSVLEGEKFILLPQQSDHNAAADHEVSIFHSKTVPEWPQHGHIRSGHNTMDESGVGGGVQAVGHSGAGGGGEEGAAPSSAPSLSQSLYEIHGSEANRRRPPDFEGRETEMYRVLTTVLGRRLTTVVGEIGVGKSALVSAVCAYMTDRQLFPHGEVFLRLEGVTTHRQFLLRMVRALLSSPQPRLAKVVTEKLRGAASPALASLLQYSKGSPHDSQRQTDGRVNSTKAVSLSDTLSLAAAGDGEAASAGYGTEGAMDEEPFSPQERQRQMTTLEEIIVSSLSNVHILVVLDQIEGLFGGSSNRKGNDAITDLKFFLGRLYERSSDVKVLLVSTQTLGMKEFGVVENPVVIGPLSLRSSIRLFARLAPSLLTGHDKTAFISAFLRCAGAASHHLTAHSQDITMQASRILALFANGHPALIVKLACESTPAKIQELAQQASLIKANVNH